MNPFEFDQDPESHDGFNAPSSSQNAPRMTIRIPGMAASGSPPMLRRSSRRHGGSDSAGPSGSEYQQSEKSMMEEEGNVPEDEEEEEEKPVMTKTRSGRQVKKPVYEESMDEEDAEGDPDIEADGLLDFSEKRTTRSRSRRTSAEDADDDEDAPIPRYPLRRRTALNGFIVEDEDEEGAPRYSTRSRIAKRQPTTSQRNGRPKPKSNDRNARAARRAQKKEEGDYVHESSSAHSADADGSDDENAPATDDMDLEMEPPPEPDVDEDVSGTDGKPYSLRQRAKINYAIPPPLEDLPRPPQPKVNRNPGRSGYHGRKNKGLGWSASGAELGKWMGLPPPDDSDSDVPTRTPRKPFGLGGAFDGAVAGGGGGLLPGDLATAGTPSNLGKIGATTLADADPLGVNVNVTFDEVGGLDEHINSLKEMTVLPLLYPEVFQQFNVTPPRGVLFHGPPGTGKTLLARALAASCRSNGKQITFFMRKGADALSKWVGEAERQLRLLFEEARASQPSIIFFDEIDGLAPVRSSKQDQIHASIVSTLLALMDGMDGRGQVVVIGATNRPDAIDPALRRPGRFDREFYFPLPSLDAREKILGIMTKGWQGWDDEAAKSRVQGLAKLTKGYGGADLRALCTEAALNAVQRKYPQIYKSDDRLLLKPESISVGLRDFMISIKKLVPSSARSSASAATPLPSQFVPLLSDTVEKAKSLIARVLPLEKKLTALEEAEFEDYEGEEGALEREMTLQSMEILRIHRPRLILHGPPGMGQTYVGAALLHHLEGYHVQSLELGTLMGDSARTVEAALVQLFVEAKRHSPSVIYIPSLVGWCAAISETARSTVRAMLDTLAPTDPVLLLAIVDGKFSDIPRDVRAWFGPTKDNRIELSAPDATQRGEFFKPLLEDVRRPPNQFADGMKRKKRVLEVLQVAPPPEPRQPSAAELALQIEQDQRTITMLKYRLGPILTELKRKFKRFTKRATEEYDFSDPMPPAPVVQAPVAQAMAATIEIVADGPVDIMEEATRIPIVNGHVNGIEVVPVTVPAPDPEPRPQLFDIDLEKMHENLYKSRYLTPLDFLEDIRKIVHNASVRSHEDPDRHFKAQAMLTATEVSIQDFDPALRMECERMAPREQKRRADYKQKRAEERAKEKGKEKEKSSSVDPVPNGTRRSARNNGMQPELMITDPVALERKLKRQRDGDMQGSGEDSAGENRDPKRSKTLEDNNTEDDQDPLGLRTPPRQDGVRFAFADGMQYPENSQPSHRFDGFQQSSNPQHPFSNGYQQPPANSYTDTGYSQQSFYDMSSQPSGSNSFLQPYQQPPYPPQQPYQQSFPQTSFHQPPAHQQPQYQHQSPFPQQPPFQQSMGFHEQPGPFEQPAPVMPSMPSHAALAQDAMVVDRPPSTPRSSGVAMLLNPVNPEEQRSGSRHSSVPRSSHPPAPVAGDDDNPFLAAPVPQHHRSASPQPGPSSILKSPEKAPTPVPERTPSPLPDFHVEETLLQQLFDSLRATTSSLTIEELEKLRATCLGCVWRHRKEWDRDPLVRELQDLVNDFVTELGENATDMDDSE